MAGLTIAGVLYGIAATAAGVLAPDRMHVMLTLTSSVSVSDLMLPLGHWLMTAAWMAVVAMMVTADRGAALRRSVGVGLVLHALILVTLFVDKLSDREAFSATVYLLYARLFCIASLALATGWVVMWLQRRRSGADVGTALDAPIAIGALALAAALTRQNPLMAVIGIAGGVIAAALLIAAPASTARMIARLKTITSNEVMFLAVVAIAALALRLLYVQRIMADPGYLDTGADGRVYDQLAWSIASGGGIPESFSNRFPMLLLGYVYFLAAIYKVAGHSYFAAVAAQSVLGAATCVLIYVAGRWLFTERAARLAAVFTALSFTLIFAAAALGHQAIDVFLTALLIVLLLRLITTDGRVWRWAFAGVVMGAAIAVRETTVFFAAFTAGWIALASPKGWRASGPAIAAYVAGTAIVVLPFVAPKLWTADARRNIRVHFDRLYRGDADARPLRGELVGPLADPGGAFAQLTSSPGQVLGTLGRAYTKNIAVQFLTQPYGGFDLVFLRKGTEYYYGMWFYAYSLAVLGTVTAVRGLAGTTSARAGVVLILGLIATRTLPHVVLESDYRHRVPIEPFLILLASVGAVWLWDRVRVTPQIVSVS